MLNRALNELLCAAMINQDFCDTLLTDPNLAIAKGYQGHTFQLAPEEYDLVTHIQAFDLADFAEQVWDWMQRRARVQSGRFAPKMGAGKLPVAAQTSSREPLPDAASLYIKLPQIESALIQ